jgi:hypothetical protein
VNSESRALGVSDLTNRAQVKEQWKELTKYFQLHAGIAIEQWLLYAVAHVAITV